MKLLTWHLDAATFPADRVEALRALGLYAALILFISCKSTAPTFSGSIVSPDGKPIALINGTYNPGKSWAERNLGPLGAILGAGATLLQAMIPAAVIP